MMTRCPFSFLLFTLQITSFATQHRKNCSMSIKVIKVKFNLIQKSFSTACQTNLAQKNVIIFIIFTSSRTSRGQREEQRETPYLFYKSTCSSICMNYLYRHSFALLQTHAGVTLSHSGLQLPSRTAMCYDSPHIQTRGSVSHTCSTVLCVCIPLYR